jgi:tetratricopeptide (TPR) repeat protein
MQVALAAFCIFALTVAHGLTPGNLAFTGKVAGWDWIPLTDRPVSWLLTLPFRLLPATWVPLALNFFAAAIAAATLGIVAWTIEQWPQPSPPKNFLSVRLPAVLGLLACGLQLNFWLEATSYSGEMLDLLLLTVAVGSLFKFHVARTIFWLRAATVLWGAGMAENWAMILMLPLFIAALMWSKGVKFFNAKFLAQSALAGLTGFALFFVPSLFHSLDSHCPWNPFECWLVPLKTLKSTLHLLDVTFWSAHRLAGICAPLFLLVPILPWLIRMKNEGRPNPPPLDRIQIFIVRGLRFGILLALLWLAFDPSFGPRNILASQTSLMLPFLTFNYLSALGAAFLAGNILGPILAGSRRRPKSLPKKINAFIRSNPNLLGLFPALLAATLIAHNLPAILPAGRPSLENFGRTVASSLPAEGGVLLAEDAAKIIAIKAAMPGTPHWVVADLRLLPISKYRAALERESHKNWQPAQGELKPASLLQLLGDLARTNKIFCLQPHDGEIQLELFQLQAQGVLSQMTVYAPGQLERSGTSAEIIIAGENFWDAEWNNKIAALPPALPPRRREFNFLKHWLGIIPAHHDNVEILRTWYSAALNDWGDVLQRAGKYSAAQIRFEQARRLNTNNYSATANLQVCTNLLAGKKISLDDGSALADRFRNIQQLASANNINGEVDAPAIRSLLGNACLAAGWPRQAQAEFSRVAELCPDAVPPRLALADIYSRCGMPAEALRCVKELRGQVNATPAGIMLETELAVLEARTWYLQTNVSRGREVLAALAAAHPDSVPVAEAVFKASLFFGDTTNAFATLDAQLAKNPSSIPALNNRAALLVQTRRAADALPVLEHALAITNMPSIRLNHAIAETQLQNWIAAENDYQQLTNSAADQFIVHLGLGEIALTRRDTNAAINHLETALTHAPPGSAKWQEVGARLEALKNPGRR